MSSWNMGLLGAVAGPLGSFDLLETTVLTGTVGSINFTSLDTYSSTYQHLQIRGVARTTRASASDPLYMQFNGVTSSIYAFHGLWGTGSTVSSYGFASQPSGYINSGATGANATANAFGAFIVDLLDPFETSKNRVARNFSGNTTHLTLDSNLLNSTTALSSVLIYSPNGNLVSGSRFSLYGIKG